jgi:hypothetical protein
MEMADGDHLKIGELRPALPEADVAAAPDVDEELRPRANPQQLAS